MSVKHSSPETIGVTTGSAATSGQETVLCLQHSKIWLEQGPAGTIARVDRPGDHTDYAGPLPEKTVDALLVVAHNARQGAKR